MADITQTTGTTGAVVAPPADPTLAQSPSTAEAAPETPAETKYVTEEALEQKAAEIIRRVQQSGKDRMKQIATELGAIKSRLEVTGVQLSPQQETALRDKIAEDLEPKEPEPEPPASALPPELKAQVDFVYAQIDATFEDVGMRVTPNDPEWQAIKAVLDDPKGSVAKAIRAAGKAAEAKAVRLEDLKSGAAARVSSGGPQTAGATSASSAHELWNNAYKK